MQQKSLPSISDVIVDKEDEHLLREYNWDNDGQDYFKVTVNNKTLKLHRLITAAREGQIVDHINGNKLDCRKSNLRFCNYAENRRNSVGMHTNAHSKYKGVSYHKYNQVWIARICVNYTQIYLGSFYSEVEAAIAYNKAAIKYFKEFARLNEIEHFGEIK